MLPKRILSAIAGNSGIYLHLPGLFGLHWEILQQSWVDQSEGRSKIIVNYVLQWNLEKNCCQLVPGTFSKKEKDYMHVIPDVYNMKCRALKMKYMHEDQWWKWKLTQNTNPSSAIFNDNLVQLCPTLVIVMLMGVYTKYFALFCHERHTSSLRSAIIDAGKQSSVHVCLFRRESCSKRLIGWFRGALYYF